MAVDSYLKNSVVLAFGMDHVIAYVRMRVLISIRKTKVFFTMLLLGRSDVFSISVALSLGVVLRLSNITPGGSGARVVGRNTIQKQDNKKKL